MKPSLWIWAWVQNRETTTTKNDKVSCIRFPANSSLTSEAEERTRDRWPPQRHSSCVFHFIASSPPLLPVGLSSFSILCPAYLVQCHHPLVATPICRNLIRCNLVASSKISWIFSVFPWPLVTGFLESDLGWNFALPLLKLSYSLPT